MEILSQGLTASETTTRKAALSVVIFAVTTFTVTYLSEHEVLLLAHHYLLGAVSIASASIAFGCWAWFVYLWMGTTFFEQIFGRAFGSVGRLLSSLIFSIVIFCIVGAISIRLGLIV